MAMVSQSSVLVRWYSRVGAETTGNADTRVDYSKYTPSQKELDAPTRCVRLMFTDPEQDAPYGVIPLSWVKQTCMVLPDLAFEPGERYYVNKYFWGKLC